MKKILSETAPAQTCRYCGGPLPASRPVGASSVRTCEYCCYGCRILGQSGQQPLAEETFEPNPWFRVVLGAAVASQAMLISLACNLAQPSGAAREVLHFILLSSVLGVGALLGKPLFQSAWEALRSRQITIELLFVAATIGAFASSVLSTVRGAGAIYYEIVAVLLTVYTVGKTLGAQSRARAIQATDRLQAQFQFCRLALDPGRLEQVPVSGVKPGDRVQVLAGEPICVDGDIENGEALVTETPLTGEPFPVVRRPGDRVLAGSFSEDGELLIRASAGGQHRRLDALLGQIAAARAGRSRLQQQADNIVSWFLPAVMLVSAGTFSYWAWRSGWPVGLFNAMAVLLVACPCAMGLATPIALWSALAAMASRGLVPQSAEIIENLARVDSVFFDKTGTLSEERPTVLDLVTSGDRAFRQELEAMLVAVERRSPHPVARALASLRAFPTGAVQLQAIKSVPARGIEAWVQLPGGRKSHLRIGTREMAGKPDAEGALLARLRNASGQNLIYIQVDQKLAGIAAIRETARTSSKRAIAQLEAMGLDWCVLSGDRREHVLRLGFAQAEGGMTPEQKAGRIRVIQAQGRRVLFVGDGLNDALAIRTANVGIALEHGAGVAVAQADAVLYGSALQQIPWAIAFCRQVREAIHFNLVFAAAYNLIGVVLAATGWLHPVAAALLMVSSSAVVCWRAAGVTRGAPVCCGLRRPKRKALADSPSDSLTILKAPLGPNWVWALLVIAQGPFLTWFGQLSLFWSVLTVLVFGAGGFGIARCGTGNAELARYAQMTFAMLGAGNWGMLLGWWAEAGFGRFSPTAQSCCHSLGSILGSGEFHVPWMYVGMLLFGLPPMLRKENFGIRGWKRWLWAGLSAIGMVLGMMAGAHIAEDLNLSDSLVFLVRVVLMLAGMLLGMLLGCGLASDLVLRARSHSYLANE